MSPLLGQGTGGERARDGGSRAWLGEHQRSARAGLRSRRSRGPPKGCGRARRPDDRGAASHESIAPAVSKARPGAWSGSASASAPETVNQEQAVADFPSTVETSASRSPGWRARGASRPKRRAARQQGSRVARRVQDRLTRSLLPHLRLRHARLLRPPTSALARLVPRPAPAAAEPASPGLVTAFGCGISPARSRQLRETTCGSRYLLALGALAFGLLGPAASPILASRG